MTDRSYQKPLPLMFRMRRKHCLNTLVDSVFDILTSYMLRDEIDEHTAHKLLDKAVTETAVALDSFNAND